MTMLKNVYRSEFNRTKIVATIGPATSSKEMLRKIILAGVDVCRVNMSHGTHEQHKQVIEDIRSINKEFNSNICILLDLQGPKLRVGDMGEDGCMLLKDAKLVLTSKNVRGSASLVPIKYDSLSKDV
ncbi:MAG: pyruvate kinase, partial [Bacteroidetes bacterium]|nr:pyruvate kinase [Bacteroidota bacterium]